MSLLIGENTVVAIDYTLTDNEGIVIDSSEGGEPLNYLHGASNIIPGLEQELHGKTEGDSLQVKVAPSQGYGEVNPDMIQTVDRSAFQGVEDLEVGMRFQGQSQDGSVMAIVIKEIEGDNIIIDGNHPLAGMELNFDVQVRSVRDATAEEIEQGHPH